MSREPARRPPLHPADPVEQVVRERHLDAAPGRVWEVISDRDLRRRFLGGDLDVDLRPGSTGTFDGPDGPVPATVRRVRTGRHVGWDWGRPDDASSVDVHLEPCEDGTHVTIRERRLAAPAPRPATPVAASNVLALAA